MKFKITLLAVTIFIAETDEAGKNKTPGFFLTLPPILTSGNDENACISLHEIALPATANVTFEIKGEKYSTRNDFSTEYSCFQLKVPKFNLKQTLPVTIQVQLQAGHTMFNATNTEEFMISPPKQSTVFLQTDRQLYKPGDLLRIRILLLNYDFLAGNVQNVPLVTLRNPYGITTEVWDNVKINQGLAHLKYQLSDETVEGSYFIEALGSQKTFQIKKYVTPRFKVSLKYPDTVFVDAKNLEVEICARYPHRQPVEGLAKIRIYKVPDTDDNPTNITETKKLTFGCASFTFSVEELKVTIAAFTPFYIKGSVTEAGTDQMEEVERECQTSYRPFDIEVEAEDFLIPGLPYHGIVKFRNVLDTPKNKKVRVCYFVSQLSIPPCSEFEMNYDNIPFTIPPLHENIQTLRIEVSVPGLQSGIYYDQLVEKMNAEGGYYFYLKQAKSNSLGCNASQEFIVYYTIDDEDVDRNLTFYYVLRSNNKVVELGKVNGPNINVQTVEEDLLQNIVGQNHSYTQYNTKFGRFNISFQLNPNILWKYKLFVYLVVPSGKIVVQQKDVELKPCFPNKVDAVWSQEQTCPGSEVVLNIRTSARSLCSITAVDEATKYGSRANFDALEILRNLIKNDHHRLPCYVFNENVAFSVTNFDVSELSCFGNTISVRSDLDEPKTYIAPDDVTTKGSGISVFEAAEPALVRNFFPETWLWELLPTGDDGEATLEKSIPHTITNWVSDVLCVSPTAGVGLSNAINLTTFQPFFVDVITPYSIKRGEILHLKIKVFNYLNQSIPVRVNLISEKNLEFLFQNSETGSVCIESGSNADFVRKIKGNAIGRLNFTVVAEVVAEEYGTCGSQGIAVLHKDIVQKTLLVEPEGLPLELTKFERICANRTHPQNTTWMLQLPNDLSLVPDSAKSKVIVYSDIFGSTVENLDSLLSVPTGCGEQIMSRLAPNLFILNYLNATGQLTDTIRNNAVDYIKLGYQRILSYLHKDGSFSSFGEMDRSGSMFLTAFVLKTLKLAQSYIYIDSTLLNNSKNWIFGHQLENGCFPPLHHTFQTLDDLNDTATPTLTSYVLMSLKSAGIEVPKNIIEKASSCIVQNDAADDYALALTSYALLCVDSPEATNRLRQLNENLRKERGGEGSPKETETLAYTLLSLLQQNDEASLLEATNLVYRLTSKMSPRGAFRSTQDTVVALDALSKYAIRFGRKTNVQVQFKATGQEEEFAISEKGHLKLTTFDLKQVEDTVSLSVSGEGCVLTQSVITYNVYNFAEPPAFNMTVVIMPNSTSCSNPVLHTCLSYVGEEKRSNMAVMEIGVPSGFRADENEMQHLLAQGVKRFEHEKDKVALYFTDLTREQLCMSLTFNEIQKVENRTAATVNVFDYYEPDNKASLMYSYEGCK